MAVAAMGFFAAMKAMSFDNTCKASPFDRADDINLFANFEQFQINSLAGIIFLGYVRSDFTQIGKAFLIGFIEVPLERFIDARLLFGIRILTGARYSRRSLRS